VTALGKRRHCTEVHRPPKTPSYELHHSLNNQYGNPIWVTYSMHIAYAYASTFDVKNFSTDTYMASICNPYGNHICVHTIWASYDNAIGATNRAVKLGRPVGRRYKCISSQHSLECLYSQCSYKTFQTMLKHTHNNRTRLARTESCL